jgi:prophage regulatory protein
MHDDPSSPVEFMRWPEVLSEIPIGANTVRDLIARGKFPAPVPLGPRAVGFVRDEVEDWKRERIAERGGQRNGQ